MNSNQQSLENFKKEIAQHKIDIENIWFNVIWQFIGDSYSKLVEYSPVWSGSYVLSHRIGLGNKDSTWTDNTKYTGQESEAMFPDKLDEWKANAVKNQAMEELVALNHIQLYQDIVLSNSCPHVLYVETTGWQNTQPYAVYGLVEAEMQILLRKAILKHAETNPKTGKIGVMSNITESAIPF